MTVVASLLEALYACLPMLKQTPPSQSSLLQFQALRPSPAMKFTNERQLLAPSPSRVTPAQPRRPTTSQVRAAESINQSVSQSGAPGG